jgi:hypothetical protein
MDDLLLPFIEASDEEQSDRCLARLIEEHAGPIVRQVLGSSLRLDLAAARSPTQDAGDLFNDIVVNLLLRLRRIKTDPAREAIADFRGYVATTAYHACHLYLRQKYPRRSRLKNRLRYLLDHDADFALWVSEASGMLCGLAAWRDTETLAPGRLLEEIRQDPRAWIEAVGLTDVGLDRASLAVLLKALFRWAGRSLRLDDLVGVVAELCRERDRPDEPLEEVRDLAGPQLSLETVLEQRHTLGLLWQEVCQLPPRQRTALLLNLRDARGRDLVSLLPFTRTATIEQIAEAAGVAPEEFARLWNDLPLDDAAIANLLGATRQQVINLRKCARERLERRIN